MDFKTMSGEEKLLFVINGVLDNEPHLLKSLAEGRTNEKFYASGKWYDHERFAIKDFFISHNIENAKQNFYVCGRLDEFVIKKYDSKILDYGINHLTYALLSDNNAIQ